MAMVTKTVLVMLALVALLITDSDAWRRRRSWRGRAFIRRAGRIAGQVAVSAAKAKAAQLAIAALGGKRAAGCENDPLGDPKVQQDLMNACPALGVDPAQGMPKDYVVAAYAEADADNDGFLQDAELDDFLMSLRVLEACYQAAAFAA